MPDSRGPQTRSRTNEYRTLNAHYQLAKKNAKEANATHRKGTHIATESLMKAAASHVKEINAARKKSGLKPLTLDQIIKIIRESE